MNTIRHRIIDLISGRMRCALVSGATLSAEDGETNPFAVLSGALLSGTFSGVRPEMFRVTRTDETTAHIEEITYWAEIGPEHPVPYSDDVSYVIGVPFEIKSTGIFISIEANSTDGMSWIVRMANAVATIPDIYTLRTNFQDCPYPRLTIYPGNQSPPDKLTGEFASKRMEIMLLLEVDQNTHDSGVIEEILGDIENELNRDEYLYDNQDCLATGCSVTSIEPCEADSSGYTAFWIGFEVNYRHRLSNTRLK